MKHFLSVQSYPLQDLIASARSLKQNPWAFSHLGKQKTLGLLFLNPSLRTRLSTQKAAQYLGLNTIVMNLGQEGWALELEDGTVMNGSSSEHIKDAAEVIGQYCDIIGIRCFPKLQNANTDYREDILNSFVSYSGRPVISLESCTRHPLQSLADILTIEELKSKPNPKVVLTWAPHVKALPQAVANSFVEWASECSYDLVVTHPPGLELADEFIKNATITHDQEKAFQDADFIYAKNWSSYSPYGQVPHEFNSWQIDKRKMGLTRKAKFLHCLPVRRNLVVSDDVMDSPQSAVIQQAGNRVYAAQAVLKEILNSHNEENSPDES